MDHPAHRPAHVSRRTASAYRFRFALYSLAGIACLLGTGCGEPGSPQPPSLDLPVPVRNLTAQRTGDTIHLSWTTTDRTTDHTKTSGTITTRICRVQGSAAAGLPNTSATVPSSTTPGVNPGVPALCERVADERYRLGTASTYDDILPVTMTSGDPSLLTYYVELVNHAQKSAGGSNAAYATEGAEPPALTGLTATLRAEGVVLHWDAAPGFACAQCKVRIERVLTSAPPAKAARTGKGANALAPAAPSTRQTLELIEQKQSDALDRTAAFGQTYEYRARRIESVMLDAHALELLGQQSTPVTLETRDTFPPAIPQDLAAAADSRSNAIDLSWTADTEPDLAGYIVYRRTVAENGVSNALLQRISGPTPLPAPAFHDAQVRTGFRYAYSVSAVDQSGNESGRSAEAQETLAPTQ